MQLSIQLIAAFAAAIAPIQALPAPGTTENPSANILARQFKNCGEDTISCNGEATGSLPSLTPVDVCQSVIDSLMDNEIRKEPRDHCYTAPSGVHAGSRCCITWSEVVPRGVPYTEFKAVAQTILDTCKERDNYDGAHISGQMHRVEIGGECMQVCLTPSKKGCKW